MVQAISGVIQALVPVVQALSLLIDAIVDHPLDLFRRFKRCCHSSRGIIGGIAMVIKGIDQSSGVSSIW